MHQGVDVLSYEHESRQHHPRPQNYYSCNEGQMSNTHLQTPEGGVIFIPFDNVFGYHSNDFPCYLQCGNLKSE